MSGFFSFDHLQRDHEGARRKRSAVLFCSREEVTPDMFEQHLRSHLERNPPPDAIYIITLQPHWGFLATLQTNKKFLARLPGTIRNAIPLPVHCVCVSATGEFTHVLSAGSRSEDKKVRDAIFYAGVKSIFQRRGGIFPASPAFHYIKPSGKHCDRFIRSAEILIDGGEIDFLACRLLEYVDDKTDYILCDSASISQLAYAVMKLRKLMHPTWRNPVVDTFRSYAGLETYDFRSAKSPLCLISASTSGDMAKTLSQKRISPEKIVTLFYLGEAVEVGHVVHDLTYDPVKNADGIPKIPVFSAGECPFCTQGSAPIRMSADYLIPENPTVDSLLLKHTDAPARLQLFLDRYHGTGTIRAHYLKGLRGFRHEIFLDVQRALNTTLGTNHFQNCFERVLVQCLPVATNRVIHLHDTASKEMAAYVVNLYRRFNSAITPNVLDTNDVTSAPDSFVQSEGTTLVVASCLVGGRSFMELSQVLRSIQTNGCISLLVGVTRFETQSALSEARSNLTHTGSRATDFDFHTVDNIFLPDNTPYRQSIWDDETDLLRQLQQGRCSNPAKKSVSARLEALERAGRDDERGLEDNLFWPTVGGEPLELRPNFAFFEPSQNSKPLTQAEVFFTISAVLHNLRQTQDPSRSLRPIGRRVVIEPTTFYRLNDGVVQAALLRATVESEIDYRLDEAKSATMREVVKSILKDCDKDRGEAATEFLLALCLERLKLTDTDAQELVKAAAAKIKSFPLLHCLATHLLEVVLKR
jgi:hypothetical protein